MNRLILSLMVAGAAATAAHAGELVPVFQESFAKCTSSVIQGGYLSEDFFFTASEHGDNDGWNTQYAYVSERALKFSAKTKPAGYAVTPAIEFSSETASTVVVRFRAQTWAHKDDKLNVCVQIEGDPSTVQKVDSDESTNVSDRNEAPFELTFTNVPAGARFRFYPEKKEGAKTDRWFLTDVVVLEEREASAAQTIHASACYQRFADLMVGNESEERFIDFGANGLTEDLTIEQPENSAFKIEKAAGWNDRTGGRLNIHFDPLIAGTAEETLTLRSGSTVRPFILYGHSKVYAPVADEASEVSTNAFTANWHRVAGFDRIELSVYTKEEGDLVAPDLMFSKYIEGKSNNRAVEIFNGTGKEVSLEGYRLLMESNGAGGLTFGEYAFKADAKIAAGGTYTICNAQYGALRDIADATIGFQDGGYANIMTFTGDDAIGLFAPDGRLIDLLGYESTDVNDEVSGNWGQDKTFYRKSSCYEPSDKFIIDQWEQHPMDYCEGYGTHTMDARGLVKREVKHLTLERGATSARIEGIADNTPCFYTIQGYSGDLKTPLSAEIAVGNAEGSGLESIETETPSYTLNGNILTVSAGATVCDVTGRTILVGADGSVELTAHGVYIVSANGKSTKIVF